MLRNYLKIAYRNLLRDKHFSLINIAGLAIVIAVPVAWLAVDSWLQDFAYRIDIDAWLFVAAGLLAVGIAQLTVTFQSMKAALVNPVKSLRSE